MNQFYLKIFQPGLAITAGLLVTACTGGLDGGSIVGKFGGISTVKVLGPETVEVSWIPNTTCNSYKIYQLSSSTSDPVATVSVPPVKIKAPIVASDRAYTFAVGCIDSSGTASGLNYTQGFSTWPKFNGIVTSSLDVTGTNPLIDLKWTYPTNQGTSFSIFAQQSLVPGDLGTWGLNQPGGYATQYTDTPICETYGNEIKIGPGTNCNPPSLTTGSIYNFKVVARYPDTNYSTDIVGNGTSILIPSSFAAPDCILTRAGLGADANNSYLFLRCSTNTASAGCPMASISTTAYQAVNGVRTVVSDTLNGPGTLRIQPKISVNVANDRLVQNLEIEYTCKATTPFSKAIARYDGSTAQLQSPSLKYGSNGYEAAVPNSYMDHPSYLGGSVAIGDFNCDGKPDLAVGLPRISYTAAPYLNQNSESGAVKIYYDYSISATGAITSASSQYLSFRDLPTNAHFGQSLSVGNINKDVHFDSGSNAFYSCDDLIIGAPGTAQDSGYRGLAYIFYGQPQGFPQPLDSAALAANAPTCSGAITSQVCAPVRLQPDMVNDFKISPSETGRYVGGSADGPYENIGASVAYIRDFNADGYGDIAIGNPNCRWDGEAMNNYIPPGTSRRAPPAPGCVYVYWGGPAGLQKINVGTTPDATTSPLAAVSSTVLNSSYVKIYPPIPQDGMQFGASISGGGDVDGRLPVPIPQNGGAGIILASGDDFVVGAPNFSYSNGSPELGTVSTPAWTIDENTSTGTCTTNCPVDPIVLQAAVPNYSDIYPHYTPKITPPWNGAWTPGAWSSGAGFPIPTSASLQGSTGIAFLYLGRSPLLSYDLALITNASSPNNNLTRYPTNSTAMPTSKQLPDYLSQNSQDRQNGSQFLTTQSPITWQNSPGASFYNCGNRGSPKAGDLAAGSNQGKYKHISCLAGRNNFSIIYPSLSAGGGSVGHFGANLAIGGAKEQNAIALYQLGTNILPNSYAYSVNSSSTLDLAPLAQLTTHDRIRGTSLWELGIRGLNLPVNLSASGNCETTSNPQTTQYVTDANCKSSAYTGRLARSIIDESYSFPATTWNSTPNAMPLTDINKDGYADIAISADAQVFTYFGNYAADFSYQGNTVSTSATCSVNRVAPPVSSSISTSLPATTSPYSTFGSRASAAMLSAGTYTYTITGQYPQFILPNTGNFARLSYLDDTTTSTSPVMNYQPVARLAGSISASAAISCPPQVKTYFNTPTSMVAADLNNDGIIDMAVGFSSYNNFSGQQIASISGQTGNGLALDLSYIANAAGAKLGSSVAATNWKFVNYPAADTTRRDLASGAIGFANGSGAIYDFTGSASASLNAAYAYQFTENSNSPQALGVERSKIVGDLNGDGYDDLWVPVKRFGLGGSIYYDALIYYGSPFGAVTYSFCTSKLNLIKTLGGNSISTSDCLGTATPQLALIGTTQIRLPQYVSKPSGVGPYWAKGIFAAGDVNRDGYADIISLDGLVNDDVNAATPNPGLYLFFGSSSGLINGPPVLGTSSNLSPQLVTSNPDLVQNAGVPSWQSASLRGGSYSNINNSQSTYPIVHGDFNGDGFEDLAIGIPNGRSASTSNSGGLAGRWTCTPSDAGTYPGFCPFTGPFPTAPFLGSVPAQPNPNAGYVIVLYGASGGYQTPINPGTGVAGDFDSISASCSDEYASCLYPAASGGTVHPSISEVYRTMGYNSGTSSYTLDSTRTACVTDSGAGNTAYSCKASLIRNPVFTDNTKGDVNSSVFAVTPLNFGSTLTVADVNHDGIDDLIVGQPQHSLNYLPTLANMSSAFSLLSFYGSTLADSPAHGAAFVYYGAKGAGVVAPDPVKMLGDTGLGTTGVSATAVVNSPVFQIYPYERSIPAPIPTLDTNEAGRNFATGMTTGDFNGDGYDDLAIVSSSGQVYIYYGPICQADNDKTSLLITYANVNIAVPYTLAGGDPPPTPSNCTLLNLNNAFISNTVTDVLPVASFVKTLHPQMITAPGSSATSAMGSTLLSARPTRSVASTITLKNPGNINGDPEKTSDLVVGTFLLNDPNVAAGNTGLGYIFFGHKTPGAGDMNTTPGLYITNSATYNGNITSQAVGSSTYYYYSPIILRPHASDGSVGSFFLYQSTLGDVNGDGTADLLMPTKKLPYGADNTTVIDGGGFKLFY